MYLLKLITLMAFLSLNIAVQTASAAEVTTVFYTDNDIRQILYKSIEERDISILSDVLDQQSEKHKKNKRHKNVIDPHMLALAISTKQPSMLKKLVDHLQLSDEEIPPKTFIWIDYTSAEAMPMLNILIEAQADATASKTKKYPSPLHKAFLELNHQAVKKLLPIPGLVHKTDKNGHNFLHWILQKSSTFKEPFNNAKFTYFDSFLAQNIPTLKELGVDMDALNSTGQTAIELAIILQAHLSISSLLDSGVEIDKLSPKGHSLLEIAILSADSNSFYKLLEHGLNPDIQNADNETVLEKLLKKDYHFDRYNWHNRNRRILPEKLINTFINILSKFGATAPNTQNSNQKSKCPDIFSV